MIRLLLVLFALLMNHSLSQEPTTSDSDPFTIVEVTFHAEQDDEVDLASVRQSLEVLQSQVASDDELDVQFLAPLTLERLEGQDLRQFVEGESRVVVELCDYFVDGHPITSCRPPDACKKKAVAVLIAQDSTIPTITQILGAELNAANVGVSAVPASYRDAQTTDFDDGPNGFPRHGMPLTEFEKEATWHLSTISASASLGEHQGESFILILDSGLTTVRRELQARGHVESENVIGDIRRQDPNFTTSRNVGHGTAIAVLAAGRKSGISGRAVVYSRDVCGELGTCPGGAVLLRTCEFLEDRRTYSVQPTDPVDSAPDAEWYGRLVINVSLVSTEGQDFLVNRFGMILAEAVNHGAVVVAAAGNNGKEVCSAGAVDCPPHAYPASFMDQSGEFPLIAVGALVCKVGAIVPDTDCTYADFSTPGEYVDLSAPGYNLTSHTGESQQERRMRRMGLPEQQDLYYPYYGGTSFSTALVTGTVALMRGIADWKGVYLTPEKIETCLMTEAGGVSKGDPPLMEDRLAAKVGAGILNVDAAVKCAFE